MHNKLYNYVTVICVFVLMFFVGHDVNAAYNKPIKLSLNSVVMFALKNSSEIEIFWQRYNQSEHSIDEAKSAYYPQVNFNMSGGREFNDPSAGTSPAKADSNFNGSFGVTLEQSLFNGFKTLEEVRRREKLTESSFWKTQSKVEEILSETVKVYLDVVRYQEEVKVDEILLIDIRRNVDMIESQYESGATGKAVLDYAKSRLSSSVTDLNKANSSRNDAVSKLEFLAGKMAPNFVAYYPDELNPDKLDIQYYLSALEEKNSRIIADNFEIEAMEHQLDIERSKFFPDVSLVVNADKSHNDGGEVGTEKELSTTVRMSYPLFDGFKRKAAKKRVESQISELSIRREQALKELRRDIKLAYNQITANFDSLQTTEAEIASSIALKELNEESFVLGDINIIELIESSERLKNARTKKIQLTNSMYFNSYKLLLLANVMDQSFFCEAC